MKKKLIRIIIPYLVMGIIIGIGMTLAEHFADHPQVKGSYSVEYKAPDGWYWHKIKNVKGDGIMFGERGQVVPARYFILVDDSRIELPMTMMIKFDPARCRMIEDNIRREAGQR